MYARGFGFKNIDLTKSEATRFIIDGKNLIPPFSILDGMGTIVAESIITARALAPFSSKEDLRNRTKISISNIKTMDALDITNKLEEDNQMSLAQFFD
jgi:DNA polymerase-3 subunit alpha (Gram-positive type)